MGTVIDSLLANSKTQLHSES